MLESLRYLNSLILHFYVICSYFFYLRMRLSCFGSMNRTTRSTAQTFSYVV